MRLFTWNITHGGSGRIDGIIHTLILHNPDLIVLTEYRIETGGLICTGLRGNGWTYQLTSTPPPESNGMLLALRYALDQKPTSSIHPLIQCRWVEAFLPRCDLIVVGLRILTAQNNPAKKAFWEHLITFAREHLGTRCVLLGEFNTGLPEDAEGAPFTYSECMRELIELGWVDAWRRIHGPEKREFTWYSNAKNGFRLDYALCRLGSPVK